MNEPVELAAEKCKPVDIFRATCRAAAEHLEGSAVEFEHQRAHFHLEVGPQFQEIGAVIEFGWEDLETELLTFPQGRHDDQVDSITQALAHKVSYYSSMKWVS